MRLSIDSQSLRRIFEEMKYSDYEPQENPEDFDEVFDPQSSDIDVRLQALLLPYPLESLAFDVTRRGANYHASFMIDAVMEKKDAFSKASQALHGRFNGTWEDLGHESGAGYLVQKGERVLIVSSDGCPFSRRVSMGSSGTVFQVFPQTYEAFAANINLMRNVATVIANSCYGPEERGNEKIAKWLEAEFCLRK